MSRSYKKVPICKVISKYGKEIANRKVRRASIVGNYSFYKKISDSYDIVDQWYYETFRHWMIRVNNKEAQRVMRGFEPNVIDIDKEWSDYKRAYLCK